LHFAKSRIDGDQLHITTFMPRYRLIVRDVADGIPVSSVRSRPQVEGLTKVSKIHDFVVKHIVADVPEAMSACLDCGVVQCVDSKWETCPNRLAREAGLVAMQAAAAHSAEPRANEPAPKPDDPAVDPSAPCPAGR
jgi:hypothetical protein